MSNALDRKGGGAAYYEYIGVFLQLSYKDEARFLAFVSLIDI